MNVEIDLVWWRNFQRLKSALWLAIGRIVDEETLELGVNATPQFIGALTEMAWTQIGMSSGQRFMRIAFYKPMCIPYGGHCSKPLTNRGQKLSVRILNHLRSKSLCAISSLLAHGPSSEIDYRIANEFTLETLTVWMGSGMPVAPQSMFPMSCCLPVEMKAWDWFYRRM